MATDGNWRGSIETMETGCGHMHDYRQVAHEWLLPMNGRSIGRGNLMAANNVIPMKKRQKTQKETRQSI
jgi:hypothetical protein